MRIAVFILAAMVLAACQHSGEFEPFREVSCFEAARVSIADAIAAAEAGGGTAIDADYRQDEELGCVGGNPGVYDVTLLTGRTIGVVSVNARTRAVGPREEEPAMTALFGSAPTFEGSPADMAGLVPRLSMNIAQAVAEAEKQGGKAMAAWIERKDGRPGYTVKLVDRGRVNVVWVAA